VDACWATPIARTKFRYFNGLEGRLLALELHLADLELRLADKVTEEAAQRELFSAGVALGQTKRPLQGSAWKSQEITEIS
jgi:hypothetical protein